MLLTNKRGALNFLSAVKYLLYPIKTATLPGLQGPRNLTAHLPCRPVQLCTKQTTEIGSTNVTQAASRGTECA